ncbi:hypothetical protein BDZ89DRAFT_1136325 [Hymenopellis radicata]|nr:hypothetical protein BDZ89DRAFT_1136320 [Hymenopellis radicata]KAF9024048.1 hypothetical protein BDZ89DRAFT_1136325 [Hymenopellis radicata]
MDAMLPTNTQWRLLDAPSVSRYLAKADYSYGHRQCCRMLAATQSITDVFLTGNAFLPQCTHCVDARSAIDTYCAVDTAPTSWTRRLDAIPPSGVRDSVGAVSIVSCYNSSTDHESVCMGVRLQAPGATAAPVLIRQPLGFACESMVYIDLVIYRLRSYSAFPAAAGPIMSPSAFKGLHDVRGCHEVLATSVHPLVHVDPTITNLDETTFKPNPSPLSASGLALYIVVYTRPPRHGTRLSPSPYMSRCRDSDNMASYSNRAMIGRLLYLGVHLYGPGATDSPVLVRTISVPNLHIDGTASTARVDMVYKHTTEYWRLLCNPSSKTQRSQGARLRLNVYYSALLVPALSVVGYAHPPARHTHPPIPRDMLRCQVFDSGLTDYRCIAGYHSGDAVYGLEVISLRFCFLSGILVPQPGAVSISRQAELPLTHVDAFNQLKGAAACAAGSHHCSRLPSGVESSHANCLNVSVESGCSRLLARSSLHVSRGVDYRFHFRFAAINSFKRALTAVNFGLIVVSRREVGFADFECISS